MAVWVLTPAKATSCLSEFRTGRVGYGSPYALGAAFTRERGISPSGYRALAVAAGDQR